MLKTADKNCVLLAMAILGCGASAQIKPRTVVANGYRFTYVEWGRGAPVVLVHGAVGDYRTEEALAEQLAAHHRVIRYSRRYHWPNATPVNITDYSPELHARDLVAFLRALKLPSVHLVGHSYGGLVALLAATSTPDVVRTLTLAEPAAFSLIEGTPEMDMRRKQQAEMTERIRGLIDEGRSQEAVNAFVDWTRDYDGQFLKQDAPRRQIAYDNAATLLPMLSGRSMGVPITCEALRAFGKPVLVLAGDRTRSWYRVIAMRASECFRGNLKIVPDSSHFALHDNPVAAAREIESFLDEHTRDIHP